MATPSDIDMTEVDESKYGEDLEKGIIGALNSPKVYRKEKKCYARLKKKVV